MIDLRCGNVLDVLRTMDAESVHCIVTSPPYWGLRAYGTEPQVWRNGSEPCDAHQWGDERKVIHNFAGNPSTSGLRNSAEMWEERKPKEVSQGNTCTRCGAWRGELGLEPTPELFVEHIVAVMREARRVLRADGTCWINLGDSYGTGTIGRNDNGQSRPGFHGSSIQHDGISSKQRIATSGLKPKDLVGIPWRVAFALQQDGWYLRSDIIWSKPNPMPESVRDRPTKAHEYLFLLAKQPRYYYDADAVRENFADERMGNPGGYKWSYANKPDGSGIRGGGGHKSDLQTGKGWSKGAALGGRNRRSVWTVTTHPYSGAHFATFPPKLIEPCILAATSERGVCSKCGAPWVRETEITRTPTRPGTGRIHVDGSRKDGGIPLRPETTVTTLGWHPSCTCDAGEPVPATVLDPFNGAGTTGLVALQHGRRYIGIDLKQEYLDMTRARLDKAQIALVAV